MGTTFAWATRDDCAWECVACPTIVLATRKGILQLLLPSDLSFALHPPNLHHAPLKGQSAVQLHYTQWSWDQVLHGDCGSEAKYHLPHSVTDLEQSS